MSQGYAKPHRRQPVDFIKNDHMQTVEALRRLEGELRIKRGEIIETSHGYSQFCREGRDWKAERESIERDERSLIIPVSHVRDCRRCAEAIGEINSFDDALRGIYMILKDYYEYPDVKGLFRSNFDRNYDDPDVNYIVYRGSITDNFWCC